MSAFVVSDNHLNVILSFAIVKKASFYWNEARTYATRETASAIGQKLLNENVRSVNYRYREADKAHRYTFKMVATDNYSAVDVLKAIQCLDYQSCETDDWRETEAFKILEDFTGAMIRSLPGYDNSKGWSL